LLKSDIIEVNVPENELMKKEKNPVTKSNGILKITFSKEEAIKFASAIRN
jgi:hypothetical protein